MNLLNFLSLLSAHISSLPFALIWLIGIVYAIVNRRKHPRTSLFAGIALGVLLIEGLVSALGSTYIQYQALVGDVPARELGVRFTTFYLCTLPFSILAWILLLVAIFGPKNYAERAAGNDSVDEDILL